ncbi:beta strand repeat-containing protein [Prosthecobacter vanneervenii]|uniref:Autotransporter-associated beta strand protein n=1 Tax=Prosthecobacter vanneervenii TaxID=48466 RepID=A0A7W7Y6N6_9BACT|nr:autotransporter-associated beta strand repeat-containing protein [Prosthecobacter vanneervenii]MBB5030608.1 autotransporter-associated beta strand protein [Prosthecobacter vanneervenii]
MRTFSFVGHSSRIQWLSALLVLLFACNAAAQTALTWDANTGTTGPQNTDGTTATLIWNTSNLNWWNGTSNVAWVNSASAIAQFGTSVPTPANANPVSIASDIQLAELRFLAVTTGSIAAGQQYTLNGDVAGRIIDFGTNGLIQMEDRSSGGSQFVTLGSNLRLQGTNLRIQKYGSGTVMQFITLGMSQNPNLTGTFTVGGSIYANITVPNTLQNVSRIIVEYGGSLVTNTAGSTWFQPFSLAGYGSGLLNNGTAYGAIRMIASNITYSGGFTLTADAGVNTSSSGSNSTGIVINAPITESGGSFSFSRFAFNGNGTLSMAAANTYSGATVLGRAVSGTTGSVTILDFTAATSPQNDILYNGVTTPGALSFIGGGAVTTLRLAGKDGQTNSQRFGNVTVGGTFSTLELLPGVGGNVNVSLGTITQTSTAGALSVYNPLASNSLSTTSAPGFFGPWLTYTGEMGRRSWAQATSTGLLSSGYSGSAAYTTGGSLSTTPFSITSNATIDNTSTGAVALAAGVTYLNTLSMYDLQSDRQISLGTGQTLRFSTSGGIQIINGALNLTVGISGQTSTLSAGGSVNNTAAPLFLSNESDTSVLTINSAIANNGSGAVTLVVNGAPGSRTVLTGTNTYTGGTQIYSGILEIRSAGALGTSGTVAIIESGGGTLGLSGGVTLNRAVAGTGGFGDGGNGAIRSLSGTNTISALITQTGASYISADAGATLNISATTSSTNAIDGTFPLTLGGAGTITIGGRIAISTGTLTKVGTGLLTLNGDSSFTGGTTISGGTLMLGNANALGAATTSTTIPIITISTGGTLDLNGQSIANRNYTLSGAGALNVGSLINSSASAATITGTTTTGLVSLTAASTAGGSGNITLNNTTGITGNFLLTKIGSGTLTIIDTTTTSARTGVNEIDAGTLRVQSALAIAPIGTGAYVLNGGTLSLGFDVTNTMTNVVNVLASSGITADRASAGAGGIVETLGALTIGGSTLTVTTGANVTSSTIGLTLGTTTIGGPSLAPGNPTFDVQSSANAAMTLTLGGLSDQAIGPRTITFQNSGSAASSVILGTAAASLVDGTAITLGSTGGALTLNLNVASVLGTLAQVTVGSGNTLNLGAAQTIGSLSGSGNITGAFVLTVGNAATASVYNTTYSGVLGFGGSGTGLTKAGLGTLTLSGVNAYTGATAVNLGTLKLASATALGATSGVTISTAGTLDLNGQNTDRNFTIGSTGLNSNGALINSSSTTSTITGTTAISSGSNIGGTGNITFNNATGLTGNFQLTKFGSGTLRIIDTTTTSARTGANQINGGTLRVESASATALNPVGTGGWIFFGGALSLGFDTANSTISGTATVHNSISLITDVATLNNTAVTHTLGNFVINNNSTLTVQTGSNVASGGTQGLTMGTVTLNGNATFDVQNSASATTRLTLGAWTDLAIAPRTLTFTNTGTAATNSLVTLGNSATSLVDGTVINLNSGTNAGVTVTVSAVTGLGPLSQVSVNGSSVLTAGVTGIVLGSLSGNGTVNANGAYTLTIGSTSTSSSLSTTFSGVLSNGTGTLTLVKSGNGTLTLSGSASNTLTGSTSVNSGTLVLAKTGGATAVTTIMSIGVAAASTAGNATVRLGADNQMAYTTSGQDDFLTINAGGTLDTNGYRLTLNSFAGFGATITGSGTVAVNRTGGTITFGGISSISSTLQITTSTGSGSALRTMQVTNVVDQLTISGSITQAAGVAGSFNKTTSGTLIFSGDNSYSGLTTVTAGILNIRSATALGTTAAGTVVNSGGTLQIQGGITTTAEGLTLAGSTGFAGVTGINIQTGALVNVSGVNNYTGLVGLSTGAATISSDSGTLNLTNTGTISGAGLGLTLAGAGDGSISSIIGITTGVLTKNGTGTWTLKGVNTSTGGIAINAGTLKLGDGISGSWNNALGLTYTGSGTFAYGGIALGGGTQGLGALTLTSGGGTLRVDAPSSGTNALTFASLASPAYGTGLNILSPASTSVTITGSSNTNGILDPRIIYNGADFAASTSGLIGAAATTTATSSLTAGNTTPYLISSSFAQTTSAIINAGLKFASSYTLTISNGVLLTINNGTNTAGGILVSGGASDVIADGGGASGLSTGGSGDLVIYTATAADSLTLQVPVTSSTTGGVTKNGAGSLTLSVASTYTGATSINAGTLILGNALSLSTSAATVQVGGVLDLNGQLAANAVTLNGTGISSSGALINNSGTAATIGALTIGLGNGTGGIGASIGGSGSITSTGVLTGDNLLVKTGTGTVTFGNNAGTALASTRVGATRIDSGTLRISNSTSALGTTAAAVILNGGALSLGSTASVVAYPVYVTASSAIVSDVFTAGAGLTHTLGALTIGTQTLTITAGGNVTTASTNAGVTFGATSLLGNPTFDVQSPSTATSGTTTLTLGALSDLGVARTLTFTNSGSSSTNSIVTLGTAMVSLIDGTLVNLNAGSSAGVTLNLNVAAALGTLAQVNIGTNSILNLGAAQTIASLSGSGRVTGAFVLTVGNANSGTAFSTTYSGVLGFGSVGTGLNKNGIGTLTLSGANAYTGSTTVTLGILQLGSSSALGATSGVTISAGGTLDLNGQSTGRNFTSVNGAGFNNGGAIINSSSTTGTITGSMVLGAAASMGGTGNITINNTTGLTGNFQLTKIGTGTLTFIDTTTTSARTGANQINDGTLRLQSAALTAVSPLGTTGAWTLNGGTLSLGFDTANNLMTGTITLNANATIVTDVATLNNAAVTQTMGSMVVNNNSTLTVQTGGNVAAGGTQGLTLGGVTLNGNVTFDVQNSATATTRLTLGAISDVAIAPRTLTFTNTGSATTNSLVTLASTTGSLVDGTVVNLNSGTNAGVTLNVITAATALGSLAQLNVNGSSIFTAGISSIVLGSLSGNGTVNASTAATLTIGSVSSSTVLSTEFTGTLGNGTGTLALTKNGLGTLTLSGANSYSGATIVSLGVLKLNNATALGATTGVTISAGGTMDLNGQSTDRNFTSISGYGQNGAGAITNSSATTATITGTTVLGAVAKIGGTGNITVSNTGGLTGNALLTKFGTGTLTFISTAASARSGANQIDAGTLRLQAATAIATIGTGAMALNGGTLSLGYDAGGTVGGVVNVLTSSTIIADRASAGAGGYALTLGALTIGSSTLTIQAGGNVTSGTIGLTLGAVSIGGSSMQGGNPVFDVQGSASATAMLALGAITDQSITARTLTFQNSGTGASTVTLTAAATSLVDGTIVNLASTGSAVTVNLNAAGALGSFAQVSVSSGNTLSLGAAQTIASLNGAGTVTASVDSILTIGNLASPTVSNSTFNGVLSGSVSISKTGSGSLTIGGSSSNTYSGSSGTVITSGAVILAKTGGAVAIPTNLTLGSVNGNNGTASLQTNGSNQIASTAAVTINAGSSMNLNGYNQAVGNLNGTPGSTIVNNAASTTATLTIGSNDATGGQFLGTIADNSGSGGTMALTKTGAGSSLLGGWNSYSGATLVQGGSLQVGGSGAGSTGTGAVTVQNGATLLGTGTVQGSSFTALSGSTVQAGDAAAASSFGTLTFKPSSGSGVIDFQAGSTIVLNLNPGGTSDLLNIIGTGSSTLLFNGNITITAPGFTPTVAAVFNLIDWSGLASAPTFDSRFTYLGLLTGNGDEASGFDLPDISSSGLAWDISGFITNGTIAIVPEPSRWMLLGMSLALSLLRRRRR